MSEIFLAMGVAACVMAIYTLGLFTGSNHAWREINSVIDKFEDRKEKK